MKKLLSILAAFVGLYSFGQVNYVGSGTSAQIDGLNVPSGRSALIYNSNLSQYGFENSASLWYWLITEADIDTFAELNAIVADATLLKSGDNVSALTNDAGYLTSALQSADIDTFAKLDALVADVGLIKMASNDAIPSLFTLRGGSGLAGLSMSPSGNVVNISGGTAPNGVILIVDDNNVSVAGLSNSEIDAAGDTSLTTRGYVNSASATLTNKTIDALSNTISNIDETNLDTSVNASLDLADNSIQNNTANTVSSNFSIANGGTGFSITPASGQFSIGSVGILTLSGGSALLQSNSDAIVRLDFDQGFAPGANSFIVRNGSGTDVFTVDESGDVVANSITGSVASATVDASGFSGNLATTDDTIQEIANKFDAFAGGGGGASQLSDLTDVNTSTATNRNVLVADGVDWESRALVEADISDLSHTVNTDDQIASEVPFTPAGTIAATNVQAAIEEVAAEAGSGSGDVVGPASATDNAIARFDTTTGKLLQNSGVTIDDSGNMDVPGLLTADDGFNLGADISMKPIVANQASIATYWGLQLNGNVQSGGSAAAYTPSGVGTNSARNVIVNGLSSGNTGAIGLSVVGAVGQTGDLQRWENSSLTELASIDASGNFHTSGNITVTGTVDGKDVSALPDISGTPANNQLAVWTDADTVEGEADLSYDGNKLTISHNSVGNFNIMGEYLVPNLSAGQNVMLEFGRAVSTKNAAEFLFNYTADGSDLNYFTLGLNGRGAITMFGDRSVDFQGPIDVTGNITVTGTVDGVDISALTGTDVALADAGAYFTTDNVEAATQELAADVAGKVDGTISGRTSVTTVTAIGTQTVANYLSDGVPSAGEWVGLSDATPEYLTTSATFNFALLDEYNYDDSATDATTITFSNMGEGHKVRIKYNRASAPTYSGETPTQLPNTFSAGSWPANDDVEAVYYKRFGTVYYFFKEL